MRLLRSLFAATVAWILWGGAAQAADVTVMGTGDPAAQKMYEKLVNAYAEKHGDGAHYTAGVREIDKAIQQVLRDALVGAPLPDALFLSGNSMRLLAERDLAVPLDGLIAGETDWDKVFSPAVANGGRVKDKVYGIAFGASLPVVLFNAELVKQAGGQPDALPKDWDGIFALAGAIDKLGGSTVGGFIEHDNGGAMSWQFLVDSFGGRMMDAEESKIAFADATGLAALDVLKRFGEAGQAHADMTRDQGRQAFRAGGIGVMVGMSSLIAGYEKAAEGKFEVLSVALPIAKDGKIPVASPLAIMLTKDPEKQKDVFQLMKFVAGPEGQILVASQSGYAPINRIAIDASPELAALLGSRKNSPAYLDRLDVATGWYAFPGANAAKISDVINDELTRVVTLKSEPKPALDELAAKVGALLK